MRIYHYTSLESLALILKNKSIRFNRLDKVDDIEEGNAESLGVKFCKYVFVSCWTENQTENIPLWKMYGGDFGGIRISIEQEMFKMYTISDLDLHNQTTTGSIKSIIPQKDFTNQNFFFIPSFDYSDDLFYRHIKYVNDVFKYTRDAAQINNIHGNRGDMKMDMKPFGYYKNKRWEFQNETRFVLYAFPFNPLIECANSELSSIAMQSLLNNKPLPFTYYDLQLKDDILDDIEITLSPSVSESERILVQALIEKYAPKAKIIDSSLGKLVRLK